MTSMITPYGGQPTSVTPSRSITPIETQSIATTGNGPAVSDADQVNFSPVAVDAARQDQLRSSSQTNQPEKSETATMIPTAVATPAAAGLREYRAVAQIGDPRVALAADVVIVNQTNSNGVAGGGLRVPASALIIMV